jgi:hypothetical protein
MLVVRRAGGEPRLIAVPVREVTYAVEGKTAVKVSTKDGKLLFHGTVSELLIGGKPVAWETVTAQLTALLDVNEGVTEENLAAILEASGLFSPDRVVRADDTRTIHANLRRHGISDIENYDTLPVSQPGTIINAAHAGFREGNNQYAEQLFLPQDNASIFVRKANNGKWSSWRKAQTSSDDQVGNIDEFGEFISIVNKTQANKPGNRNGMLLSLPYNVYRPEGKYGNQMYFTEVEGEMYIRTKTNNVWGAWKKVLTDGDIGKLNEKVSLDLNLINTTHFTFDESGRLAKFIGYRQAENDYLGYIQVDASVTISAGSFTGEGILQAPAGWQLAETHQTCGDLFTTGSGGHAWRLWSENDNPNETTLIRTWDNNADIPRSTKLRLMYNFPCVLKKTV